MKNAEGLGRGDRTAGEGALAQALEMKTPALSNISLHRLVLCMHTCRATAGVPFWLSSVLRSTAKKRNGHRRKGRLTLPWLPRFGSLPPLFTFGPEFERAQAHPASFLFPQNHPTPPRPPVSPRRKSLSRRASQLGPYLQPGVLQCFFYF